MRKKVINILWHYKILSWLLPIFHYLISRSRIKGKRKNTINTTNSNIYKSAFNFGRYKNNSVYIDKDSDFHCSRITIKGNNNTVYIGANSYINDINIIIEGDNNTISIGTNTFVLGDTRLYVVDGSTLRIGNGCMFSDHIEIRTTDNHAIYDVTQKRINFERDIIFGDNVWLGMRVIILKGVILADGVIVGAGSVVTRSNTIPRSIIAGNPAALIKRNVTWTMSR